MAVAIVMPSTEEAKTHPFFKSKDVQYPSIDPNYARRKRRKSASPARTPADCGSDLVQNELWIDQLNAAAKEASSSPAPALGKTPEGPSSTGNVPTADKPDVVIAASDGGSDDRGALSQSLPTSAATDIRIFPSRPANQGSSPKKMLQVRSDGKLSSPKSIPPSAAGRGRRSRRSKVPDDARKLGMVIIKYGKRKKARRAIAARIDAILSSPPLTSSLHQRPQKVKESEGPTRPTHPFFTGDAQTPRDLDYRPGPKRDTSTAKKPTHPFFTGEVPPKPALPEATGKESATTEAGKKPPTPQALPSLKKARVNSKPPNAVRIDESEESMSHVTFGTDHARLHRFPGAQEAAWPASELAHVGRDNRERTGRASSEARRKRGRKLKDVPIAIDAEKEILYPLVRALASQRNRPMSSPTSQPTQLQGFRSPTRLVVTGDALQDRLRALLTHDMITSRTDVDPEADELGEFFPHKRKASALLSRTCDRLKDARSAFDNFQCEYKMWALKYAPQAAEEILQHGPEAMLLRDWLRSLTVSSVNVQHSANALNPRLKISKKKRKRKEGLDDFIVSDDEEMDEITTLEGGAEAQQQSSRSTIIQRPNGSGTGASACPSHAAIISGPHGCGKTAAVYAIANELGFEVFEINSGSRRNGRDIIEKVGDMTHNHLVQNDQGQEGRSPQEVADDARHDEKVSEDLASGKQKTMGAFFKAKPTAKKSPPRASKHRSKAAKEQITAKEPKSQKQSLILLEEVDVLFEEDKPFWTTVLDLIISTRRPVIMTCTDESLLPLEDMSLYGIFRLGAPPTDQTVDYLLLLAGLEGHLLKREAVLALYEARCRDLRATLAELQFYCQMAIGDRKGGLDWMLLDLPPEHQGHRERADLRVVSEDSYQLGMGWLGGNITDLGSQSSLQRQVDMLMTSIHEWMIDADSLWSIAEPGTRIDGDETQSSLRRLEVLDKALEAASMSDLLPAIEVRSPSCLPLDATQPPLPEALRCGFTESPRLIQADESEDKTMLTQTLALTLRVLSANLGSSDQTHNETTEAVVQHRITSRQRVEPDVRPDPRFEAVSSQNFPLTVSSKSPSSCLLYSPVSVVSQDIAPYVRSIVAYDLRLEEQRRQLSAALAQPGRDTGKVRKTRASRAALEGGSKAFTRRERWFPVGTNYEMVLKTGGAGWLDALQTITQGDPIDNRSMNIDMVFETDTIASDGADSVLDELR